MSVNICDKGHDQIVFASDRISPMCPVCLLIEEYENDMESYRSEINGLKAQIAVAKSALG